MKTVHTVCSYGVLATPTDHIQKTRNKEKRERARRKDESTSRGPSLEPMTLRVTSGTVSRATGTRHVATPSCVRLLLRLGMMIIREDLLDLAKEARRPPLLLDSVPPAR